MKEILQTWQSKDHLHPQLDTLFIHRFFLITNLSGYAN
jgi:hypothetical protein